MLMRFFPVKAWSMPRLLSRFVNQGLTQKIPRHLGRGFFISRKASVEITLQQIIGAIIAAIVILVLIGFLSRAFISYPTVRVPGVR